MKRTLHRLCLAGLLATILILAIAAPRRDAGATLALVTYVAALKTKRMQSVIDKIDGKTFAASTGSAVAGKLVIGTSALSGATGVLVTIILPTPSFVESGGVITLQGVPLVAAASASGTAAKAELRDNADAVIVSGLTVGTSGTDIIIDNVTIVSGESNAIFAGTITHG